MGFQNERGREGEMGEHTGSFVEEDHCGLWCVCSGGSGGDVLVFYECGVAVATATGVIRVAVAVAGGVDKAIHAAVVSPGTLPSCPRTLKKTALIHSLLFHAQPV